MSGRTISRKAHQEGEYTVTVTKKEAGGSTSPGDMMKKMGAGSAESGADLAPENELPQMYADPKTSGFTASVSAGPKISPLS